MTEGNNNKVVTAVKKEDSGLKSFLSGGIGGACLVLVGHPLDLVKVKMQTLPSSSSNNVSVFSMLRSTAAKEGIRGLYRGVSAPIFAVAPVFAVCFWGFDMGKRIARNFDNDSNKDKELSIAQLCFAGGFSAIPTTALMAPSERIKCLLQIQPKDIKVKKYNGMIDCGYKICKENGIRSLFKGTYATLLRDIPGSIAYFGVYEVLKREIMKYQNITDGDPTKLSTSAVLTAGGFAGIATWIVAIPADVIKSRYQTAPEGKYTNLVQVFQHLVKEEGYSALFKGLRPALLRAFPANAACFYGMELSKTLLSSMD